MNTIQELQNINELSSIITEINPNKTLFPYPKKSFYDYQSLAHTYFTMISAFIFKTIDDKENHGKIEKLIIHVCICYPEKAIIFLKIEKDNIRELILNCIDWSQSFRAT